ncbi:MAG: pyrimidine 5'-nucleotidase [Proteobacteria bacterium]|nr:pyrimidine 5'-nucleotidase [Pseudomonadota bacterium]
MSLVAPKPYPFADIQADIRSWIFDLDDTLYSPELQLFQQVKTRITAYVKQHYCQNCQATADALQQDLRTRHHTTLAGLMAEHSVDPEHFMDYVHDIDISGLGYDAEIDQGLARLSGRKLIFTNASKKHARRILAAAKIDHHFDFTYDIVAAGYRPKPEAAIYADFTRVTGVAPQSAVMIDDTMVNLMPASALGIQTLWLTGRAEGKANNHQATPPYVQYTAPDLKHFFASI